MWRLSHVDTFIFGSANDNNRKLIKQKNTQKAIKQASGITCRDGGREKKHWNRAAMIFTFTSRSFFCPFETVMMQLPGKNASLFSKYLNRTMLRRAYVRHIHFKSSSVHVHCPSIDAHEHWAQSVERNNGSGVRSPGENWNWQRPQPVEHSAKWQTCTIWTLIKFLSVF